METYLKIIFSILLFFLLIPFFTKAITFENPFKTKSFEELIDAIINFIFWVAMAIAPIMIIIAAFYFLTSGGNPEKVNIAKKIILFTLIGLFIVLSGKGIVSLIEQIFQGGPSGPPPPPPPCTCNAWVNDACGAAGCTADKMHQTRTCTYHCLPESQCVIDPACAPPPPPLTCADIGYYCCCCGGCRGWHRNDLDPTCGSGEFCCQLGCCPDLNPGETCPVTCGDLCFCPSQGVYIPPGSTCH